MFTGSAFYLGYNNNCRGGKKVSESIVNNCRFNMWFSLKILLRVYTAIDDRHPLSLSLSLSLPLSLFFFCDPIYYFSLLNLSVAITNFYSYDEGGQRTTKI